MSSEHVYTMNLFDDGEGMVPLQTQDKPSTAFKQGEKNMSTNKDTMDSTPINDIMMEPPAMTEDPRVQGVMPQMVAAQPQAAGQPLTLARLQQSLMLCISKWN